MASTLGRLGCGQRSEAASVSRPAPRHWGQAGGSPKAAAPFDSSGWTVGEETFRQRAPTLAPEEGHQAAKTSLLQITSCTITE